MEEDIKVSVIEYADRKYLMLGYRDPITRRLKTKSAKTTNRKLAEKAAAVWEDELRTGRYAAPSRCSWEDFRERYETEVAAALAGSTQKRIGVIFGMVEARLNPQRLRDVTTARLSWLASDLRKTSTEASIHSFMAHLKAALRWAERVGLLAKAPTFPKLQTKGTTMKGRPITGEEFDRMLAAVPKVVKKAAHVAEWRRFLRGLYWSGFRITEGLSLSWVEGSPLAVDMSGKYPVVHIAGSAQKSRKTETVPLAPEFVEMLQAVPVDERVGFVFRPLTGPRRRPSSAVATETISAVGKEAGVKVWTHPKTGKVKFASAHDLRRAFGTRWSTRVMPDTLRQMMRHASISTTMAFYVGRTAEATGGIIHDAFSKSQNVNTSVNSTEVEGVETA